MELYKIIQFVIPTMCNHPCKIAIYADGSRVEEGERRAAIWAKQKLANYAIR